MKKDAKTIFVCLECGESLYYDEGFNSLYEEPDSPAQFYCEECGSTYMETRDRKPDFSEEVEARKQESKGEFERKHKRDSRIFLWFLIIGVTLFAISLGLLMRHEAQEQVRVEQGNHVSTNMVGPGTCLHYRAMK